jgi:hypothetical protein
MRRTKSSGGRRIAKAVAVAALMTGSASGVHVPAYAAPDPNTLAPPQPNGPGDLNCPTDAPNATCQPGPITRPYNPFLDPANVPYNPFLDPANVQSPMNPSNPANPAFPGY